jgi:hypothetical protein
MVALDTQLQTKLKEQGMSVNRPDPRPFRTLVKNSGLYAQWKDHFGPSNWAILERAVGGLT